MTGSGPEQRLAAHGKRTGRTFLAPMGKNNSKTIKLSTDPAQKTSPSDVGGTTRSSFGEDGVS
ncbi:hypothetical protein L218DRAFT_298241 [Marasmius fiardii PR-910]|nr:hypothetical protein L218DRAFT_298241 [Marasmius fiardii PR-910]